MSKSDNFFSDDDGFFDHSLNEKAQAGEKLPVYAKDKTSAACPLWDGSDLPDSCIRDKIHGNNSELKWEPHDQSNETLIDRGLSSHYDGETTHDEAAEPAAGNSAAGTRSVTEGAVQKARRGHSLNKESNSLEKQPASENDAPPKRKISCTVRFSGPPASEKKQYGVRFVVKDANGNLCKPGTYPTYDANGKKTGIGKYSGMYYTLYAPSLPHSQKQAKPKHVTKYDSRKQDTRVYEPWKPSDNPAKAEDYPYRKGDNPYEGVLDENGETITFFTDDENVPVYLYIGHRTDLPQTKENFPIEKEKITISLLNPDPPICRDTKRKKFTESERAICIKQHWPKPVTVDNDAWLEKGHTQEILRKNCKEGTGELIPITAKTERSWKPWNLSLAGRTSIIANEGMVLNVYMDSNGFPTIGVGHLIHVTVDSHLKGLQLTGEQFKETVEQSKKDYPDDPFSAENMLASLQPATGLTGNKLIHAKDELPFLIRPMTKDEALDLFDKDLPRETLNIPFDVCVPLYQREYDAIVDACFNGGAYALEVHRHPIADILNRGQYSKMPQAFYSYPFTRPEKQVPLWVNGKYQEKYTPRPHPWGYKAGDPHVWWPLIQNANQIKKES